MTLAINRSRCLVYLKASVAVDAQCHGKVLLKFRNVAEAGISFAPLYGAHPVLESRGLSCCLAGTFRPKSATC